MKKILSMGARIAASIMTVVMLSSVILSFSAQQAFAANGSGSMLVSPTTATASSTGGTYTFTYTAAEAMNGGEVSFTVPSGWSTPQGTSGVAGYTTVSSTGTIGKTIDTADSITNWNHNTSNPTACSGGLAVDTSIKFEGTGSVRCINSSDKNNGLWYKNITSQNWSTHSTVGFWIRTSAPINNNDLNFDYDNSANIATPIESLSLGTSILANTWTRVVFNFGATTRTSVVSYGLHIKNLSALGSTTVWFDDLTLGGGTTAPTFNGNTVSVRSLSLAAGQTITFTYGAGGGTSGVTAPGTPGIYTFTTQSRVDGSGTLTNIASSPTVTVSSPPTVTGVTSSLANGSYTVGQVIPIQVNFSEAVTVTGTPQLTLSTGSPATTAVNYSSGSGTSTLTFNYTVAAGNTSADLDYA
ncbi:MAG: hypothetical protein AAB870_05370, partial [Patescibacteria group bacterium]